MPAFLRRPASMLAVVAFAAAALAGTRASAQMVPRLVSYTRASVVAVPCKADLQPSLAERRTVAYGAHEWKETVTVYGDAACAPQTALLQLDFGGSYGPQSSLTVAYRTVTPTIAGQAFLQRQCGGSAWTPGVAQDFAATTCDALGALAKVSP